MTFFLLVFLAALAFEYINGFHDAANAIATVVSTRVLTPRQTIFMAAVFNLVGASMGTVVAVTIGKGLVDAKFVTLPTLLAALLAAIGWGLLTWWLGRPNSSSHALIGGLCGAALASARNDWSVLRWNVHDPIKGTADGLWPKVVLPMVSSPGIGFVVGMALMALILVAFFWIKAQHCRAGFRQAPAPERGGHGVQPRLQRRAEDDGPHHAGAGHGDERENVRRAAGGAGFFARARLPRRANLGRVPLRADDGRGHGGRGLPDHPHDGS